MGPWMAGDRGRRDGIGGTQPRRLQDAGGASRQSPDKSRVPSVGRGAEHAGPCPAPSTVRRGANMAGVLGSSSSVPVIRLREVPSGVRFSGQVYAATRDTRSFWRLILADMDSMAA